MPPWKPLSIVSEVCIHKVWGAIIAPTSGSFPTMIFLSGFLIHCDLLLSFELMQDIFSEVSDFFFFTLIVFIPILTNVFKHFKYFVFGIFTWKMCIATFPHQSQQNFFLLIFCTLILYVKKNNTQTFRTIYIDIKKKQNSKINSASKLSYPSGKCFFPR